MQFTVAQDDFVKALAAASGVVSPKATLPMRLAGSDSLTGVLMPLRTIFDEKQLAEAA